jgi:hypothetical protein
MAKAKAQVRKNNFNNGDMADVHANMDPNMPNVGAKMVKAGKATHPHWRSGKGGAKQAKRMYGNADTAHGHTKVGPGY